MKNKLIKEFLELKNDKEFEFFKMYYAELQDGKYIRFQDAAKRLNVEVEEAKKIIRGVKLQIKFGNRFIFFDDHSGEFKPELSQYIYDRYNEYLVDIYSKIDFSKTKITVLPINRKIYYALKNIYNVDNISNFIDFLYRFDLHKIDEDKGIQGLSKESCIRLRQCFYLLLKGQYKKYNGE